MSATFTSTGCRAAILRITSPQPLRWPAAIPLQEREVEEAAMPGQPVRTRARFPNVPGNSPSRIASCHQRHRNRRSASVEKSNVFAAPTLRQNVAPRNRKPFPSCAETVDDSTSLWKPEENEERTVPASRPPTADSITYTVVRKQVRKAVELDRDAVRPRGSSADNPPIPITSENERAGASSPGSSLVR
jgi:hypothetical protein